VAHCHPEAEVALAAVWRLTPDAARRWLACECQAVNNPTNPLNIRWYGRHAQVGRLGGFATYVTARASFADGLAMVRALSPHYGYAALLASLGTGDTYRQVRAIELSSWAAGHYGATASSAGCLSRGLAAAPIPTTGAAPMDPTVIPDMVCDVSAGATAYALVGGALVTRATGWAGAHGVGTYGVQPHGEPPRPEAAAPLRAIRVDLAGGPAVVIEVWYVGEDHVSNLRPR